MRRAKLARVGLLLAGLMPVTGHAAPCEDTSLEELWRASGAQAHQPPGPADTALSQALFERELKGDKLPSADDWEAAGFQLLPACAKNRPLRVIKDKRDLGQGFFVFDQAPRRNLILQAPHRDSDRHSGEIALRLFIEGGLRAAAWNTVHRRGPDRQRLDTDLAHLQRSHFQSMTAAAARQAPKTRLLQLHGYAQAKRRSEAGRASRLILSAGRPEVSAAAAALHACLVRRFGSRALLYPTQIRELGGTTNAQSRLLQASGHSGFLHLELSRPLRDELQGSVALRATLLRCLDA